MDIRIVWGSNGSLSEQFRHKSPQVNNDSVLYASEADVFTPQASEAASSAQAEIEAYIKKVFTVHANQALAIATCESQLNPYAYNPETEAKKKGITPFSSCGVFQINGYECSPGHSVLFDYRTNVDRAFQLYLQRGWSPWKICKTKLVL